jgi:hypothetical protein
MGAMSADALLERLHGVRRTGEGRWIARCPAHKDRSPSLSVRELEDGRTLVHCFGGCEVGAVLGAAGVEFNALFPPRPMEHGARRPAADRFPAADVLRAIVDELAVVAIIAGDLEAGRAVSAEDFARLRLARDRIEAARRLSLGER